MSKNKNALRPGCFGWKQEAEGPSPKELHSQSNPLGHISLGSLQGVQLEVLFLDLFLHVGREVAGSFRPFHSGFAVGLAKRTRGVLDDAVASDALIDDGIALPAVVGTTALLHEDAFGPRLHRLALHGSLPPFLTRLSIFVSRLRGFPRLLADTKKRATKKPQGLFGNSFWYETNRDPSGRFIF